MTPMWSPLLFFFYVHITDSARITSHRREGSQSIETAFEDSEAEADQERSLLGVRKPDECKKATGGTCWLKACKPWRNGTCSFSMRCLCDADACVENGRCVAKIPGTPTSSPAKKTGTANINGSWMSVEGYTNTWIISGTTLIKRGKSGKDITTTITNYDTNKWKMRLGKKEYRGRYSAQRLKWDDGDVWARTKPAPKLLTNKSGKTKTPNVKSMSTMPTGTTYAAACASDKYYVQRRDYIDYAIRHYNVNDGVVHLFEHLTGSVRFMNSLPSARNLLGWHSYSSSCELGSNRRRFKSACETVTDANYMQNAGDFSTILAKGSNGSLCKIDAGFKQRLLSRQQMSALAVYSSDSEAPRKFYKVLNEDLINQTSLGKEYIMKKWSVFMFYFLGALDCLDPSGPEQLYRGIRAPSLSARKQVYDTYRIGRKVVWTSVVSLSSDLTVARDNFALANRDPELAIVLVVKKSLAYPISSFSQFPHEAEYIIPPMSQFEVTTKKTLKSVLYIFLTQMDHSLFDVPCINKDTYVY